MIAVRFGSLVTGVLAAVTVAASFVGCRRGEPPAPPVARPTVTLNRDKAPLGSPVEINYKFAVPNDVKIEGNHRVMFHILDANEELIWADDHDPPVPTSQWKAGQTVEYTRTVFTPLYPYVGETLLRVGLYSRTTGRRLPLEGDDAGQRAYNVGKLQLQPPANVSTIFKDGWHPAEVADRDAAVEWRWTRKQATLAFRNPKRDSVFYLDLDNPGDVFTDQQRVRVSLGDQVLEEFQLTPKRRLLKKIPIAAGRLGAGDMSELQITVDKTFVPKTLTNGTSKDPRELGVRVFRAIIAPTN